MAGAAPCSPSPGCALLAALRLLSPDSAVFRETNAASPPLPSGLALLPAPL